MKAWKMKIRLYVTNLSSENNMPMLIECSSDHPGTQMMTGAFSQNVGKLFLKLKLVTDNLLFIYAEANWEATENEMRWYSLVVSFPDSHIPIFSFHHLQSFHSLVPRLFPIFRRGKGRAWELVYASLSTLQTMKTGAWESGNKAVAYHSQGLAMSRHRVYYHW